MSEYSHDTALPHPHDRVWDWLARAGALTRLSPRLGGAPIIDGVSPALAQGQRNRMRIAAPGTFGAIGVPWVADHPEVVAGSHFVDVMAHGPMRSWRHAHRVVPDGSGTRLEDRIRYTLPLAGAFGERYVASVLKLMFAYRRRQLAADLDFHAGHEGPRLRIGITGASGLVGTQLHALLATGGHEVVPFVRRPAGEGEISWDPAHARLDRDDVAGLDALVNLAGRPIATRFTRKARQEIRSSRVQGTALLSRVIASLPIGDRPATLVSGSAIGIYGGSRGDERLTEASALGAGFLAEVCREWESATRPAEQAGVRVVHARTGLVLSAAGGVLAAQLPAIAAGLGPRLGGGRQWQSWIGIDDMVAGLAAAAIEPGIVGPINLSAPEPVRQVDLVAAVAARLHRPSGLPVPLAVPRAVLGTEATEQLLAADQRVSPAALLSHGFTFRHPGLEAALDHLLCTTSHAGEGAS